MKKLICCFAIVLLCITSGVAQTKRKKTSAKTTASETIDKSWTIFWSKFKSAVKKNNKVALKKLMDPDFFGGVGAPESRNEWLLFLDNNNLWEELQKSVSKGTISTYTLGRGNSGGMITYKTKRLARKTKDGELLFEFYNKRWWFVSVRSGE